MQTRRHMTNAREALVTANKARKVTTAINAMSSPKVASASMVANASTRTSLALVTAPLAGSRRVRVVLAHVVALRSGQADQEVLRDRLPVAVLEIHQEVQVEVESRRNRVGSLQRVTVRGVTNVDSNTVTRQRRPHADAATQPISRG